MDFFSHKDYRKLVNEYLIKDSERGIFAELARYLSVSKVYISQVFKGSKALSLEQASAVCDFFGLNPLEEQYFILLVSLERASSPNLINYYKKQLAAVKEQSKQIVSRVKNENILTGDDQIKYYSSWKFSAARMSCALNHINSAKEIAEHLRLSEAEAQEILSFLLEKNLVKREQGKLKLGVTHTHLPKTSPLVSSHHKNWRNFAMSKSSSLLSEELMYTAPMVISNELAEEFQKELLNLIQQFLKRTEGCPDEEVRVLNIDFLQLN